MKYIVLFYSALVCTFHLAQAQDIIVKMDKTEIKSKVLELTETSIKYKKFEMLDGPTYNIAKADVFMIMYQNGTKEYIETKPAAAPASSATQDSSIATEGNTDITEPGIY